MPLTNDPNDPRLTHGVDTEPAEQAEVYLVVDDPEPFVRPVRSAYVHTRGAACGCVTTMAYEIAATFARHPDFYGATYCTHCRMHLPVSEFDWLPGRDESRVPDDQRRVGS